MLFCTARCPFRRIDPSLCRDNWHCRIMSGTDSSGDSRSLTSFSISSSSSSIPPTLSYRYPSIPHSLHLFKTCTLSSSTLKHALSPPPPKNRLSPPPQNPLSPPPPHNLHSFRSRPALFFLLLLLQTCTLLFLKTCTLLLKACTLSSFPLKTCTLSSPLKTSSSPSSSKPPHYLP